MKAMVSTQRWAAVRETWNSRHLIPLLAAHEIRARYRPTFGGWIWAVLKPLLGAGLFTLVFSRVGRLSSGEIPYPLVALGGMAVWQGFSATLGECLSCLAAFPHLLTKVYLPRLILPLHRAALCVFETLPPLALLLGAALLWGFAPRPVWLLLPVAVLGALALGLGLGLWGSVLALRYRDLNQLLPFLLQGLCLLSPVGYPASAVPLEWRPWYALNPLVGYLETVRSVLFHQTIPWGAFTYSLCFTLVSLVLGAVFFLDREGAFAEHV